MSLVDALLLDPYRDPRDLWLAVRSDAKGSGTIDDPMDAGTRRDPAVSLTGVTFSKKDILVISHVPHGYSTNDTVKIQNVTTDPSYNTTSSSITKLNDNAFILSLATEPTVQHEVSDDIQVTKSDGSSPMTSARIIWPVAKATVAGAASAYVDLDAVTIAGVSNSWFSGDFVIFGVLNDKSAFYYRLRHDAGDPPSSYSATGTFTSVRWVYRFDEIMRALPDKAIVRLGPGTFETRGLNSLHWPNVNTSTSLLTVGYQLKDGTRLMGSGIGATTLKLVNAVDYRNPYRAVGASFAVNGCEICDLSVDCAMPEQPVPYGAAFAMVSCGAVQLYAQCARVRRVRAIRFGVQAGEECFVLFVSSPSGAPSRNSVIEDCIVEQPAENNIRETTLIGVVGDHVLADNYGGVVRHCFTNCAYQNAGHTGGISNEAIQIVALTQPDSVTHQFTVTTARPHNRSAGQNVVLSLVRRLDGTPHPYFNSSFEILSTTLTAMTCKMIVVPAAVTPLLTDTNGGTIACIGVDFHGPTSIGIGGVSEGNSVYECRSGFYTDTGVGRSVIQRDNYYSGVTLGSFTNFLSDGVPAGEKVRAEHSTLIRDPADPANTLAKFTAENPHNLRVGMAVRIQGATINHVADPAFNGFFTVESVGSPGDPIDKVFYYRMNSVPGGGAADADSA